MATLPSYTPAPHTEIHLGDYTLTLVSVAHSVWHKETGNRTETWRLSSPQDDFIGSFDVAIRHDRIAPALNESKIYSKYRGKGLGRLVMKALVNHYGHLRSDDQGRTSEDAIKAWRALGAEEYGKAHIVSQILS